MVLGGRFPVSESAGDIQVIEGAKRSLPLSEVDETRTEGYSFLPCKKLNSRDSFSIKLWKWRAIYWIRVKYYNVSMCRR